jgi:hypothetical protein
MRRMETSGGTGWLQLNKQSAEARRISWMGGAEPNQQGLCGSGDLQHRHLYCM